MRRFLALALLLAFCAPAAAEYPDRPVRLIIPFPPGGSNDVVGRLVANQLSEKLGNKVFVDNRGGAGGVLGTEAAATAAPDGYTLLVVSIAHAVNRRSTGSITIRSNPSRRSPSWRPGRTCWWSIRSFR
jgi:tripartite-type tricarboxylate transporter receptor subunit TctC